MSVAAQVQPTFDSMAAFSEAVGLIYEARLDPTRIPEVSRAIERLLNADDIVICSAPPQTAAEFQKRINGRMLCLDIAANDRPGARLIVRRRSEAPPFRDADVNMLSLLRPHLQRAEWLASLLPHGVLGALASDTFVSLMNKGLVVTDVNAAIEWCNPAAAAILAAGAGLTSVEGRLRAGRAFETTKLIDLLHSAAGGQRGVMLVSRGSLKQPFGLAVTRLLAPAPRRSGDPLLVIAIKEMEREIDTLAGRLGELFGLTAAEERLAILLLNGHTLQSAADASHKTLATVKTQLHSMLKKTGARGQAELINVLLSLPSLI